MKNRGFTLIELSVVIVIIGLIVAGIIAGQALVEQAKIRSIVADVNKYRTAMQTFIIKYDAVAGDMTNGASFFSGVHDGNGNRRIGSLYTESRSAWRSFYEAGLIAIRYDGMEDAPGAATQGPGGWHPTTPLKGESAFVWHSDPVTYTNGNMSIGLPYPELNMASRHTLRLAAYNSASSHFFGRGSISPKWAHNIDQKLDDGVAYTGKVVTYRNWGSVNTCVNEGGQATPSRYVVTNEDGVCEMIFHF